MRFYVKVNCRSANELCKETNNFLSANHYKYPVHPEVEFAFWAFDRNPEFLVKPLFKSENFKIGSSGNNWITQQCTCILVCSYILVKIMAITNPQLRRCEAAVLTTKPLGWLHYPCKAPTCPYKRGAPCWPGLRLLLWGMLLASSSCTAPIFTLLCRN